MSQEIHPVRPHTRLGILATLMGVAAGFIELVATGVLTVYLRKDPDGTIATVAGLGAWTGAAVALVGLLVSLATMFSQSRRKLFGVTGLLLNGIVVLVFCSLVVGEVISIHGKP